MPDFEAGYDFVPLTIGLRQTLRGETSGIMGTKQVVERLVQFDCVGAIRMPDDLGYTTGMPR